MQIIRITKIKNHRIFRDFSWPDELLPFAQFNLIYGWNGSGKTTLSSLFQYLQDKSNITEGQIKFALTNNLEICGSNLTAAALPSFRVFNRDFIAKTIKSIDSNQIAPIYFLGEDDIEKQQKVESLKAELNQINSEVNTHNDAKNQAEKKLNDFYIAEAKAIKEFLLGASDYANYDKRRYQQTIQRLKNLPRLPDLLSDNKRQDLIKQKQTQAKPSISLVSINVTGLNTLQDHAQALLQRSIVSQKLDELVADPKLGRWVQDGLILHSGENETQTCRFCDNKLTTERRLILEKHFNDAFSLLQDELSKAIQQITDYINNLKMIRFPDELHFYDHLVSEYRSAVTSAKRLTDIATQDLENLKELLQNKKDAPFASLNLKMENQIFDKLEKEINVLNTLIQKHEDTTLNLSQTIKETCELLEQDEVLSSLDKYDDLKKNVDEACSFLKAIHNKPIQLKQQIYEIEKEIIEHHRPAEELTKELKAYLGRDELQFETKENGYILTRSGRPALNLSEGERTAIAFLYFLKSLKDKSFDIKSSIIVIDDPVSSLDANSLFSAFAYMKERTKNAGQLFILTHNFGFFRQVKNWFHHLPHQKKKDVYMRPARFYSLVSEIYMGQRLSKICAIDPLLEEYESEYHFLFRQIYDIAHSPSLLTELAQFYSTPNIARRLIETFLAYKYPDCKGLWQYFEKVNYDSAVKVRILRFLHTYSHSGGICDPEHDPSILAETQPILLDILKMIEKLDPSHFSGMEKLMHSQQKNLYIPNQSLEAKKNPQLNEC